MKSCIVLIILQYIIHRTDITFAGDPVIELLSDRALVTFVNLTRFDFEAEAENCSQCFILIDVHFIAVLAVEAIQLSAISVTVTYDPAFIHIPVH